MSGYCSEHNMVNCVRCGKAYLLDSVPETDQKYFGKLCPDCQRPPDVFDEFAIAMREKFKNKLKSNGERSTQPWKDYGIKFLRSRLADEMSEYDDADDPIEKSDEAIDIAEFAMFLWKKNQLLAEKEVK